MTHDARSRFNVNVIGSGAQTLVLAHGFGSDQTAWRYQIEAFLRDYRIVLFDYLGCGKADISSYSPLDYSTFDRYKDDVLAIYEALNLTDTIFIGHSVSSMIGMLASLSQPHRFKKLVFVGASPRYLNDGDYIGGFERRDLDQMYEAMAANYLNWANGFGPVAMGNPDKPELGQEFARSLSAMRPDIAQSTARVIFESDMRSHLPRIQHPTLVLQSRHDIAVPLYVGDYLAAHIPNSYQIRLNSLGHLPHLSAPYEVTTAVREFINQPAT